MSQTDPGEMEDGDRVIVVGLDRPPASLPRRIVRWIGGMLLWVLFLAPGFLVLRYGLGAIVHERLVTLYRRSTMYGNEAVGWGWLYVGLGLWALGEMSYAKTHRVVFRVIGWILGIGASIVGFWILCRNV